MEGYDWGDLSDKGGKSKSSCESQVLKPLKVVPYILYSEHHSYIHSKTFHIAALITTTYFPMNLEKD